MKLLGLFLFLLLLIFSCSHEPQKNQTKVLKAEWSFNKAGDSNIYPAIVPGNIHIDLMRNQLIDNPLVGINESQIQWIEKTDWIYKGRFIITDNQLQNNHIELEFTGLDTYAEVFLNHHKLLSAKNMFLAYQKEVKPFLVKGENLLEIRFFSPINTAMPLWEKGGVTYPADNDKSQEHLSVFTRKAAYQYGWDWGPRLVTSGIWRPVLIRFWNDIKIQDLHIIQKALTPKKATLKLNYEIVASKKSIVVLEVVVNDSMAFSKDILLDSGLNRISFPWEVTHPKLWWPQGMGVPNLYKIKSIVNSEGNEVSTIEKNIGLRTLKVINEPDSMGESFYIEINGADIYIKGANYIPNSSFPGEVEDSVYERVFKDAVASNFNMLRVWGGGYYENDKFYDLADENGILIWQDFMFACTTYPSDSQFLNNIENEAIYNIKRLRNHPCLALWCGNNEVEVGWKNWGWQQSYHWSEANREEMIKGYYKIFKQQLPEKVRLLDSGRFYFSSSPISNWGNKADFKYGDNHFWGVWWGKMPFESFNEYVPRFMSEFGFQSFPSLKTIEYFADSSQWKLNSPSMISHQKSSQGTANIEEYMERNYGKPTNFADFVYLSQVMQAEGMRVGIEAQRRNKPFNMGSLYWQFNDVWPGISWSGIDYFGRWKALQFFVKKAYAPIISSAVYSKDSLQINIISDLYHKQSVVADLTIITFDGDTLWNKSSSIILNKNENRILISKNIHKLIGNLSLKNVVLVMNLSYDSIYYENCFVFEKAKKLELQKPEIQISIKPIDQGYRANIRTNTFTKNLELSGIEGVWSDNYFDLVPNKEYVLIFKTKENSSDILKKIKFSSVWGKIKVLPQVAQTLLKSGCHKLHKTG